MKKKMILPLVLIIFLFLTGYFFIGTAPEAENIVFGVNFSQKHSKDLGLDWKENYLMLFDNLGVKNLKLITHWDLIEFKENSFYFDDLDWQIKEAEERGVRIFLAIGIKTGRWPECHVPDWAKNLTKKEQQDKVFILIEKIVLRYLQSEAIWAWQVENEPLFPFGECDWKDKDFVKREIDLVRSLDPKRKIIFGDSGEASSWITAANFADIIGITMYKKVWFDQFNIYVYYPLPPVFYWRKSLLIKNIFNKRVMVIELQAEPWGPKLLYDTSLKEQEKTMTLERFKDNVDFAKKTGFDEFYLWGAEWWYWMWQKQGEPAIWLEAKKLFQ